MTSKGSTLRHIVLYEKVLEFPKRYAAPLLVILIFFYFIFTRSYQLESKLGFDHDQEKASEAAWALLIDKRPSLIGIETSTGGLFVGPLLNLTHAAFLY